MEVYQTAEVVHIYLAARSEVLTVEMVRSRLSGGKRVVVPCVDRGSPYLLMSELIDYDHDLISGYNGVLEPKTEATRTVPLKDVSLMVLPGVAFDLLGFRLGYGTGFYDRLLGAAEEGRPILIGLAFEAQIIAALPVEDHDVPMDWVITEDRVIPGASTKKT